nr:hypothetical protein [Bacteroidia bacterium]
IIQIKSAINNTDIGCQIITLIFSGLEMIPDNPTIANNTNINSDGNEIFAPPGKAIPTDKGIINIQKV